MHQAAFEAFHVHGDDTLPEHSSLTKGREDGPTSGVDDHDHQNRMDGVRKFQGLAYPWSVFIGSPSPIRFPLSTWLRGRLRRGWLEVAHIGRLRWGICALYDTSDRPAGQCIQLHNLKP